MNNQQREGKKPSYQDQLAARCEEAWGAFMESDDGDWGQLYEFVKQVALESWKNGVEAGRKRVGSAAPQQNNPRAAKVYTKGSALANGKLKAVQGETAVAA